MWVRCCIGARASVCVRARVWSAARGPMTVLLWWRASAVTPQRGGGLLAVHAPVSLLPPKWILWSELRKQSLENALVHARMWVLFVFKTWEGWFLHNVPAATSSCGRVCELTKPGEAHVSVLASAPTSVHACVHTLGGVLGVWTPAEASRNSITSQEEAHAWRIGGKLRHSTQKARCGEHLFTTSGDDGTDRTCADEFGPRALSHHQMPSASVALAGCPRACRHMLTCTRPHYLCYSDFLLSQTHLICQTSGPKHGSSTLLV